MKNTNQNERWLNNQKKEQLVRLVEPLEKNYFIVFMIWKISFFSLPKATKTFIALIEKLSDFLRVKSIVKHRRNIKRREKWSQFFNPLNTPRVSAAILFTIIGGIQILQSYTGASVFRFFTKQICINQAQIETQNWLTFHISDSPYLLKRRPLNYLYEKISLLAKDYPIEVTFTAYAQNRLNQFHFGFISLNLFEDSNSNIFYNNFNGSKYPIYIQQITSNVFDSIPRKMEGASNPHRRRPLLFQNANNIFQLDSNPFAIENTLKKNLKVNPTKFSKKNYKKNHMRIKQVMETPLFQDVGKKEPLSFYEDSLYVEDDFQIYLFDEDDFDTGFQNFLRHLFNTKQNIKCVNKKTFTPLYESPEFLKLQDRKLKSRLASFRINFESGEIKDKFIEDQFKITKALRKKIDESHNPKILEGKIMQRIKEAYRNLYAEMYRKEIRELTRSQQFSKYEKLPFGVEFIQKMEELDPEEETKNPIQNLPEFREGYYTNESDWSLLTEIFEKLKSKISQYNNEGLRGRSCSGYQFPDQNKMKNQVFVANQSKKIKIPVPTKYRNVLTQGLIRNFENREQILYPTAELFGLNQVNYTKFQKIYRNYKSNTFGGFGQTDKIDLILAKKTPRIKNKQFVEIYENPSPYSWLAFTKIAFIISIYLIYKDLYKEHWKEFVVSLIDLVEFLQLINDGEFLKEELNLEYKEKNYRAVRKVYRTYDDIVGMPKVIARLSSTLWYLRGKTRFLANIFSIFQEEDFLKSEIEPLLLVGPPGTGKTILVQAFTGEAGVPVLLQSGGVLKNFKERGKGAKSIRAVFSRARREAPCVVFIDEVDSIGRRRPGMSLNTLGWRDTVEIIGEDDTPPASLDDLRDFFPESYNMDIEELDDKLRQAEERRFGETLLDAKERREKRLDVLQEIELKKLRDVELLAMLTQLLIELDGLHPLLDILVFGATNRPYVLDPALLRSGRFSRLCQLTVPSRQKRLDLLKLYTGRMGETQIKNSDWAYLTQRLEGFTAADIATIINESSLITGIRGETHSVESIEIAIERVTSYPAPIFMISKQEIHTTALAARHRWFINNFFMKSYRSKLRQKTKLRSKKVLKIKKLPLFTNIDLVKKCSFITHWRALGYNASGQAIVHTVLPNHPSSIYFSLQKRIKNFRYGPMHGLILNFMDHLRYRSDFECRLIGLLAGKAAEYLSISSVQKLIRNEEKIPKIYNLPNELTSAGWSELIAANLLSFLMSDKWYFYGEWLCIYKTHPLLRNTNTYEFIDDEVTFYDAIVEDKMVEIREKNRLIAGGQRKSYPMWWVRQIVEEEEYMERIFMKWYRIYLSKPEESERNIEWCPPEEHYTAINIKGARKILYWEKILTYYYDHFHHSLLLNCLNTSYSVLSKNRELLDYLTDFVLRHEKGREPQIKSLMEPFLKDKEMFNENLLGFKEFTDADNIVVLARNWGEFSRRKHSRILKLNQIDSVPIQGEGEPDQLMLDAFAKLEIDDSFLKHRAGLGPIDLVEIEKLEKHYLAHMYPFVWQWKGPRVADLLRAQRTQEPEVETQEPEVETQEPEVETQEPEVETQEPEVETQEPEVETQEPEVETQEPEVETQEPEDE